MFGAEGRLPLERTEEAQNGRYLHQELQSGADDRTYGEGDGDWIVRSESDVRVGGAWTIHFGPSAEELYRHHHVYEEIERPSRLLLSTTEGRITSPDFDST